MARAMTSLANQRPNLLARATPGETEQMYIVGLCEAAKHVLENSMVEHGSQDPDNNDCMSNPADVEPFAYVKRFQTGGKKAGSSQYRLVLCSTAFIMSQQSLAVHHYTTKVKQIAALLVHEAFHQVTEP